MRSILRMLYTYTPSSEIDFIRISLFRDVIKMNYIKDVNELNLAFNNGNKLSTNY